MAPSNRRSLAARKMEKMMIGVIEKGYSRQPALTYPIANPDNPQLSHMGFIQREMMELEVELDRVALNVSVDFPVYSTLRAIDRAMDEIADVSNTLDFCFERLMILEDELRGKKD